MAVTEAVWKAAQAQMSEKGRERKTLNEAFLKQSVVEAKLLTGHEAWDRYLQKLQVLVDEAEGELKGLYERLGTPLTEEQVRLAYISVNVFTERLRVLKHCMTLPHELIAHAEELGLVQP